MERARAYLACTLAVVAGVTLSACSKPASSTDAAATPPAAAAAPPAAEPAAAPTPEPAAPVAMPVSLDATDPSGAKLTGDPASGAKIFRQCQTCHSSEAGKNMIGPSLHGVIGRAAGTVPGFKYSTANKNSGITWTEQEIYTYLENPKARVPGTFMTFVGLKDSQQRADVIAYLTTQAG